MNDEIKEAAERLRRMRKDSNEFDGGYPDTGEGRRQSKMDHLALAEAYLAEHPADDDEPVSEDWFRQYKRSYRISDKSGRTAANTAYLIFYDDGLCFVGIESDMGYGSDIPAKTRGDVRRLCAALGIELDEQTDDE